MTEAETREKREERRRRFRTHLDLAERAAHFGYWRFDLRDNSYYWSPGMYRLLGEDPGNLAPNTEWIYEQVTSESRAVIESALETAIRTGSSFSYRTYVRNPDKAAQIVDTQGEVEVDEDGRTITLLGVCHDVTAEVRAEEERAKAETMYRLMTEESGDIIILYDTESRMMFCSNALERVLKRSSDEIRNGGYKHFIHPDDHEEASKMEARPVDGDILIATWRFLHGDGHYVWLETTLRTVFDPTTHMALNVISVSRDITARKEHELEATAARAKAEAANQAKSRFLANMSHELRTPLNAIIGFSDLMRMRTFGPLGSTRYEDYATLIHDSGQLLLDHISDLLDMARIEAGKLELSFERVDLAGTIEDTARLLRQRADAGDIALSTEVDTALSPLFADRRAVKQIIINLVSNAIKFTPPGGHVRIAAAQDDGTTRIAVSDDGIGIPASDIHRLGKPFEQVCGDPMLAKSGTGLGLALVRALAEKHGGALAISGAEGIGTEVSVTFPRNPANRSAA